MGLFGRDKDDEGQGALRFQMREKLMSDRRRLLDRGR